MLIWKKITVATLLILATQPCLADDAQTPVIDLSIPSTHTIVEEDHRSVRPGALDEKFAPSNRVGNTEINLSYEDDEPAKDEYGIVRDIKGPASTDYSKPPTLNSND